MIPTEPKDLEQLIAILRAGGVSHYEAGPFKLQLYPGRLAPEPVESIEIPKCKCGHVDTDHGPGGCSHGCDQDQCLGKPS